MPARTCNSNTTNTDNDTVIDNDIIINTDTILGPTCYTDKQAICD